jgi:hypothetical protein
MSERLDFPEMDRLLEAALETPGAERARWVAMVPGLDEAGRRELARLIRLAEGADDVLPAAGAFQGLVWEELARELGQAEPPLRAGDRVGVYEVRGLVGAGGMGCVYRAFDPVLGRDVAVKALLRGTADAAGARRRLEQEARLLATLNHPNIAAIYGSEQVDGVLYLILELVEGETLAERLRRGPLPAPEAIAVAQQVTHALEEAHHKGIVHRDLKPSNITIMADGRVKVLDFGIARPVRGPGELSDVGLDAPGASTVMGTPAYMSPEQRRGEPVGTASDIWALGCVLYEMLAGQPAFESRGPSEKPAADTDELDWCRLPADVPPGLVRLLGRCLRRAPQERFAHVAAVRAALEEPTAARDEPVARGAADGTARRVIAGVLVAAALLVDLIAFGRGSDPQVATTSPMAIADTADTDLAPESHLAWADESGTLTRIAGPRRFREARLSPDGRWVAFCIDQPAGSALWTLDLETAVLQRVAFLRSPQVLVWTPDGRGITVANFGRRGWWRLRTFSVTSSHDPVILYEGSRAVYANAWSADGRSLIVQERRTATDWDLRVLEVGADGRPAGAPRDLAAGPLSERNAALSPDGRWVAYESGTPSDIHVVPFGGAGRTEPPVARGALSPQWGNAGQLYYWSRVLRPETGSAEPVLSRLAWSGVTSGAGMGAASSHVAPLSMRGAVLPTRYDLDRSRSRPRFLVLETGAPALDRPPLLRPVLSGVARARMPRRFRVSYAGLVGLEEDTHAREGNHRTSSEGR